MNTKHQKVGLLCTALGVLALGACAELPEEELGSDQAALLASSAKAPEISDAEEEEADEAEAEGDLEPQRFDPYVPKPLLKLEQAVHDADVNARAKGSRSCATVIPQVPAGSQEELDKLVRRFVGTQLGVSPEKLDQRMIDDCRSGRFSPAVGQECNNIFDKEVRAFDGRMADALRAPARTVDEISNGVKVRTMWVMNSSDRLQAAVSAGIHQGYASGVVAFRDGKRCNVIKPL